MTICTAALTREASPHTYPWTQKKITILVLK